MVLRNGSNLSSDWSEMNGTGAEDGATSQAIRVDELDHFDEAWVKPFPLRDGVRIRKGERFADYYTLFEEIGEGKFGKVYRCVEKATNLMLAAKCIKIRKDTDFEKVEKEVNIMTQMRHKCIAQIYDAFATTDNDVLLVMEIVQGGELFDRVADDSYILTEMAVALIMFQICEAIRYIHSQNIIHLDLKPENIMCVSQTSNQIKLIDFGLAQWYDGSKDLMFMAGTPEFAAPEVIKYEPLDFHTDMWSLGVIAYILLSGQSPFLGETLAHTYCNVERGNWMFCEEFAENGISSEAKDFISKLLILQKERRMLPDECLRHPWIHKNRERALLASRAASPAVCHPLAVDKFRKYVKNKRFRRLVFGVLFINQVMRMMQTMQRNKSVHGVEYVRNLLVAVEQRQATTDANNNNNNDNDNNDDNKTSESAKNNYQNAGGIGDRAIGANDKKTGTTTTTTALLMPKLQQRQHEGQTLVTKMDTGDSVCRPTMQRVVIAVTPPAAGHHERRRGDSVGIDASKAGGETKTAASTKKKVVKRVPRGEKRSKSEARRAADQQRTRSSTEQTSNKKQRQDAESGADEEQQSTTGGVRTPKSPLTARRLGDATALSAATAPIFTNISPPVTARQSREPSSSRGGGGGGTSDTGSGTKSPMTARRSPAVEKTVKFEEMVPTAAVAAASVPKPVTAAAVKRLSGGDSKVLRIATRLVEEHQCYAAPSTSAMTTSDHGGFKRLSVEAAAATVARKKTAVPSSSSSNVSAMLKKLEQKGAEAASSTTGRPATPSSSRRSAATGASVMASSWSASPLSLAVTAFGPAPVSLKKMDENGQMKKTKQEQEQQQQNAVKVVKKKKKRVLRVRTADEEQQQRPKRLGESGGGAAVASAATKGEQTPAGMKQQKQPGGWDKAAQKAVEEKPKEAETRWRTTAQAAQNGHGAVGIKPKEQLKNGGAAAANLAVKQSHSPINTGIMSPRAKQRLKLTKSVPLSGNGGRKATESIDAMDEGWGVVGQDVFDFSLLRKKLQNRIMGLKDQDDLETEAENQQRFELQKQQNMLRTNLNIKRAMRKWISMDRETKQHNNGMISRAQAPEVLPDWAR